MRWRLRRKAPIPSERVRVFRSCPLITPKDAQSSLQMLAIARYGCALRLDRTPFERAARSRPKNSHPLSRQPKPHLSAPSFQLYFLAARSPGVPTFSHPPKKIDPPMTRLTFAARASVIAAATALLLPLAASAQNIAIVNGKAVPKARLELLLQQAQRAGQQVTPEMQGMAKDEVVKREMFAQEAEKRGIAGQADYKAQMELARQSILIRELFEDFKKKNPVTDAEAKAEYEKFKTQSTGIEFRASHILVEGEEEAKALIAQIKGGAKFEDLAKTKSKDPGSGANGGDLDFAKPESYVPEFGGAMAKLKKGEMTEAPIKTQFGWHIIRLDDTRDAQFPDFESIKPQIQQRLAQSKLQKFQDDMRKAAKTDYKFAQ